MTTLHVLRHAKSSWADSNLDDVDRPLSDRGRRAATAMAAYLEARSLAVDLVLVSPARRTRQTWDLVGTGVDARVVRVEPSIYAADVNELLDLVRATSDDIRSLLLVGHNPGCYLLTTSLTGSADDDASVRFDDGYPTGAFATLIFDRAWKDVAPGSGRLVSFVRPRQLE
jgi:phosphohistidine phosphatase